MSSFVEVVRNGHILEVKLNKPKVNAIDQAMSRLKSMQSKVDRLEAENKELKSYKRWAEHRILNSSPE